MTTPISTTSVNKDQVVDIPPGSNLWLPSVKIEKASKDEVVDIPMGSRLWSPAVMKRFEKIDQILYAVMITVTLSVVALIVAVIGLFLDQMRYNNAAYTEYSEKLDAIRDKDKSNEFLLNENKQNQEKILQQQENILKSLE